MAGAFTIARGAKAHVDVVVATLDDDAGHVGRGEGTPIYYHGETAETVRAQLMALDAGVLGRIDIQDAAVEIRHPGSVPGSTGRQTVSIEVGSRRVGIGGPRIGSGVTVPFGQTSGAISECRSALSPSPEGEGLGGGLATSAGLRGQAPLPIPPLKGRGELEALLPRGAARNALDAAWWDLRAKQAGRPVWMLAGLDEPGPLTTAFTISLGAPARMEADARAAAGRYPLLKLKLAGAGDVDRVAAVRRGAPDARLIVDANEAWTGLDVAARAAALVPFGVELIEQPVAAGRDAELDGIRSPIPLCADESCQDRSDLPRLIGRYDAVNVKLDKAGGLTEALALTAAARAAGLDVMIGCMLSTSLGVAPAFLAAQGARWVDLDGPLLLARDRAAAIRFDGAVMHAPPGALWG